MAKFIVGDKLIRALYDAGALPVDDWNSVRRVVIDLNHGYVGMLYVELFADSEKIEVALLAGLEVTETPEPTLGRTLP